MCQVLLVFSDIIVKKKNLKISESTSFSVSFLHEIECNFQNL